MPSASAITSQWVSSSPQVRIDISTDVWDDSTVTVHANVYYIAPSPAIASDRRTWTVTIDGQTRTGGYYINGVTGTHLMGQCDVVVARAASEKTINFSLSFPFNLTWSGVYGGTRSCSGSIVIRPYSVTTYTITFDANGGSGAPNQMIKKQGEAIRIPSQVPTRIGYGFDGWSLNSATGSLYRPGSEYSTDANATFYARWSKQSAMIRYHFNLPSGVDQDTYEDRPAPGTYRIKSPRDIFGTTVTNPQNGYLAETSGWSTSNTGTSVSKQAGSTFIVNPGDLWNFYLVWNKPSNPPVLSNVEFVKCNSNGTPSDNGSYCKITGTAKAQGGSTLAHYYIDASYYTSDPGSVTIPDVRTIEEGPLSGTSWTINKIVSDGNNIISSTNAYQIILRVVSSAGDRSVLSKIILPPGYIIDCLYTGAGVSFLKSCSKAGVEFGGDTYFNSHNASGINTLDASTGKFMSVKTSYILPPDSSDSVQIGLTSTSGSSPEDNFKIAADYVDKMNVMGCIKPVCVYEYRYSDNWPFKNTDQPIPLLNLKYNTTSSSDPVYFYRSGNYIYMRAYGTNAPGAPDNMLLFRVHGMVCGQSIPNTNMACSVYWERTSGGGLDLEGNTEGYLPMGIQTNPYPGRQTFESVSGSIVMGITRINRSTQTWRFSLQGRTSNGQGTVNAGFLCIELIN